MDCLINPERQRGDIAIRGNGVLCILPNEAMAWGRVAKEQGWRRQPLHSASLWVRPDGGSFSGPAMGAPMAVMLLEKLIALGGRRFVVFGSCGALAPGLAIGDCLVPTWAVSQEGTSRHYPLPAAPRVSTRLTAEVHAMLTRQWGQPPARGGVWTTDAPYREGRETIRRLRDLGVAGVDMELSALLTVAAFRGVELAAVLVVSDLVRADGWQAGFTASPFKTAIHAVGRALFDFCGKDEDD
jgi:uridine phosphorylase